MPGVPLLESAHRLARFAWLEERCFEIVGAWAATTPEPEAKLLLATQSRRHGERAASFAAVLPVGSGLDALVDLEPDGAADPVGVLDAMAAPTATVKRVAGLAGVVLPAVVAAHDGLLTRLTPIADGPARRVLERALADERAELAALGRLLAGLAPVGTAAAHREHLAVLLDRSPGLV